MTYTTQGIHHVTAISGEIDRTLDFYGRILGLRMVKQTVNYDDPGTWHLYFADEMGRPGTVLTFFPWPGGVRGRRGVGQAAVTGFLISPASIGLWTERLRANNIEFEGPTRRFDDEVMSFADPDGMQLELIARPDAMAVAPWDGGPVPAEHAIRGFHGVTLWVRGDPGTAALLTEFFGYRLAGQEGARTRFMAPGPIGNAVELLQTSELRHAAGGVGTVHHIAFRAPDDATQLEAQRLLWDHDIAVTPVRDRQYFRSIYFREPGGVLFEIATDGPGFTTDESPAQLGTGLRLPSWLEPDRDRIARNLPPLPAALPKEQGVPHAVR